MDHSVAVTGVVERGQQLGRRLGFPTANIACDDPTLAFGVYATWSQLPDGRRVPGVASYGRNPTTGLVKPRLEVWLFDFDEDLYGRSLATELVAFLRAERKFATLEELKAQVLHDAEEAKRILGFSKSQTKRYGDLAN